MKLDKESLSALVKLVIFCTVTGLMTLVLALTLSNGSFGAKDSYRAIFTDATGVTSGDVVSIAGVSVGSVSGVKIVDKDKAEVSFDVKPGTPLTGNTTATIRFRNLVGNRYLALEQGANGAKSALKPGSTIPMKRTEEALDLNVLLNGFKPVLEALSPDDTNKLAFEIVQTLQGESGNVEDLLARTSSLTNTLAGRDQLIGDVVTNLSQVLDTIGNRDTELTQTIDNLQQFVTGLKQDRGAILNSIDSISALTNETSSLLIDGRPDITTDVKQLRRLTANLSKKKNLNQVEDSLQILPIKLKKVSNLASNGSLFNFYACTLNINTELFTGTPLEGLLDGLAGPLVGAVDGKILNNFPDLKVELGGDPATSRCATEPGEYP